MPWSRGRSRPDALHQHRMEHSIDHTTRRGDPSLSCSEQHFARVLRWRHAAG